MQEFSQDFTTETYGPCTFYFRRLYTTNQFVYYVSTDCGNPGGHAFTMVPRTKGGWRIINAPKVPDWIEELEDELSDVLMANCAEEEWE